MKLTHLSGILVLAAGVALANCAKTPDDTGSDDSSSSSSSSGGKKSSSGGSGGSSGTLQGDDNDDSSTASSSGSGDDGTASSSGSSSGSVGADGGAACAANDTTQTSFVNLAVPMLSALSASENDPIPMGDAGAPLPSPAGWNYYAISGAMCRDGSPAGIYVHHGTANKLFIYLEGGGACSSPTFCSHNPAAVSQAFPGGAPTQGQTIGGSLGSVTGGSYQEPYVPTAASGLFTPAYSPGIFDFTNAANPVKDWSGVYVPYCTGDVHFGTADNVTIPGDGVLPALTNQHFVGYLNMKKFIGHLVPTFPNQTQVLLTGASAGGFGAGLNYGMVQDSFGTAVPVTVLDDSGPPFLSTDLPACIQKQWRELWGFDAALPSDCAECTNADGSGLTDIVKYWHHKYPHARVGLVSTVQDEVMRLFFGSSNNNCASNNATALAASGGLTGAQFTTGLQNLVTTYQCTGALATYYIGGSNSNFPYNSYHQHIFRSEFYTVDTNTGSQTMAQWTADLLAGTLDIVGP